MSAPTGASDAILVRRVVLLLLVALFVLGYFFVNIGLQVVFAHYAIALGYLFAALFLPMLMPIRVDTKWSGRAFFLLCASTHIDAVLHYLLEPGETYGESFQEPHMLLIHVPQAFAIWFFVTGFFRDLRDLIERAGRAPVL